VIPQDWQHEAMHTTDTPDTTLRPATLADAHRPPAIDSAAAGRRHPPTPSRIADWCGHTPAVAR
jgi:hypothetical protein